MRRHRHLEVWAHHALEALTWAGLPAAIAIGFIGGLCAGVAAWLSFSVLWVALAVVAMWAEGL